VVGLKVRTFIVNFSQCTDTQSVTRVVKRVAAVQDLEMPADMVVNIGSFRRTKCPPPFPHQRSVMLTSVLQDALTNMVVKYMQIVHTIVPKGVQ